MTTPPPKPTRAEATQPHPLACQNPECGHSRIAHGKYDRCTECGCRHFEEESPEVGVGDVPQEPRETLYTKIQALPTGHLRGILIDWYRDNACAHHGEGGGLCLRCKDYVITELLKGLAGASPPPQQTTYTRNEMVEVLTALWDMQSSPDCWCDAGEGAPMHSPACAFARDVARKHKALAYPLSPSPSPNGLYGESHLKCVGGRHLFPKYVTVACQCGEKQAPADVLDSPSPSLSERSTEEKECK